MGEGEPVNETATQSSDPTISVARVFLYLGLAFVHFGFGFLVGGGAVINDRLALAAMAAMLIVWVLPKQLSAQNFSAVARFLYGVDPFWTLGKNGSATVRRVEFTLGWVLSALLAGIPVGAISFMLLA